MAATIVAQSAIVAKAAAPAQRQTSFTGLARISLVPQAAPALPAVQNGSKTRQMLVWQPKDNKYFETFSYLPPLTSDQIAKQVDYMVGNGWIPTLEFANADQAYVSNENTVRMGNCASNYYDNRYWTMYKLPMFGCTDAQQVLTEISNCEKTFPDAYIRLVAFDSVRQVQITGLLVHRPPSAADWRQPADRSV